MGGRIKEICIILTNFLLIQHHYKIKYIYFKNEIRISIYKCTLICIWFFHDKNFLMWYIFYSLSTLLPLPPPSFCFNLLASTVSKIQNFLGSLPHSLLCPKNKTKTCLMSWLSLTTNNTAFVSPYLRALLWNKLNHTYHFNSPFPCICRVRN